MSDTMKIIELLNKIANGEDVPKKICYKDIIFEYDNLEKCYIYQNEDYSIVNDLSMYLSDGICANSLNEEVEIINNIDSEVWKTIIDFPNYEISTKGNIRTKEYRDSRNHLRQSKLLEKQINNVGYEYVILSNEIEKHKTLTIHRLVAKTFLNDYNDDLEVNHINGVKTDNRIENLEMTTHCENIKKRYKIGNNGNNYKAIEQYDLNGNYIATYKSSYEAEKITGIGRTCIGGCCRNEQHTAGGYMWKFKNNIEEDKKKIEHINLTKNASPVWGGKEDILAISEKINELIDEVNKLKEN